MGRPKKATLEVKEETAQLDKAEPVSTEKPEVVATAARRPMKRTSVSGARNVLTVEGKEPGFEYRIVNDDRDRIARFEAAGYEVVTHPVTVGDSRVGKPSTLGTPAQVSVGGGQKAYVMRIRKEWYDEDQKAKRDKLKEDEKQIFNTSGNGDYGSIKVERS